uniref:MFS transporter n=1 Tax=Cyberlindnera americana TaxID=36016 RepID=A0A5P8N8E8_9ASCO|nr:MFS transporter [Cyberlindnera americana]
MVGFIADEVKFFKKKEIHEKSESEQPVHDSSDNLKNYLPNYGKSWIKVPHLVHLNLLILIISLTSTNTGYDGSLLNAFQSMPDWMAVVGEPSGAVLGAITNGVVFGVFISFFVASTISDKFGRRHAIAIGNIIMIIGTIIQSCAGVWTTVTEEHAKNSKKAYAMFLVARIILGVGNGIATVSSPPLISELSYPSHRQAVTAFFNSNWYLGAIISGWVSFGTRNVGSNWSWRVPSIVQGFFPLVQAILIYFVPESPRYLVSKGKNEEARTILLKFHGGNDEAVGGALVDFEMSEIELAIEQEKLADKFSYKSFFQTPGNRKRLFLLSWIGICMQLSGNGLVSYYLSKVLNSIGITSTSQQLVFNGGLMIFNYGISIIINLFAFQNTKRRTIFITSIGSMLFTYVIWTILSAINQKRNFEDKSLGKGVMAMIFFYYIAYNLGLNGLPYLYLTEILPFTIRAKGINLCLFIQQIMQIYNGFVNPIAMDAIEWKYYIVYCCILAVELVVCYLTFVETSGRTLEEVAEVFGESINEVDVNHLKAKAEVSHVEDGDETSSVEKSNNLLV